MKMFEVTVGVFSLYVEAVLGADWHQGSPRSVPAKDRRKASRAARIARLSGRVFPNHLPHALRVSGRLAAQRGQTRHALKIFDRAIQAADRLGAESEKARSLIDKSMLRHEQAEPNRRQGLQAIEDSGCVLPEAELCYLGIDGAPHHARAAAARERKLAHLDDDLTD